MTKEDLETKPEKKAEEYIYETHITALWNTINFLGRGMAFYLAINAALFGYVITAKIEVSMQKKALAIGLITSLLFAICSAFCIRWCRSIGRTIKRAVQVRTGNVYDEFGIEQNFVTGEALFIMFGVCMWILVGRSHISLCVSAILMTGALRQRSRWKDKETFGKEASLSSSRLPI